MIYILKRGILFFLILMIAASAIAQKRLVNGYVRDSVTGVPIVNAIITNESSKQMITPDQNGFFSIRAERGDFIFINAFNYDFDTIKVNYGLPDTLHIQLIRTNDVLPNVTVTTTTAGYTRYQLDSLRRRESFVNDMGGVGKMSKVGKADNMGAGIGINLDAFSRNRTRDRNKAYRTFDFLEDQAYVDYRFSPQAISDITGLKGDSLVQFMRKYTPTYKWLRKHTTDEDVLYYVNDKMKEFGKKP